MSFGLERCHVRKGLLAAVLVAGCAAPTHVGTEYVATQLGERTGNASVIEETLPDGFRTAVDWEDGLTEEEAALLGLWNNPSYRELLADLGITEANLIEAAQLANPAFTTMFPVSAKQWEFTLMVPIDVFLLRPLRVAAAQLESYRVAERLVQDGLNVVRDVRLAYVDLALAEEKLRLAEEAADLRSELARIAEARLKAGAVSELDVAPMRLEVLFGNNQLVQARRDLELAREKLRFLLGASLQETEVATTGLDDVPTVEVDVEELVAEAVTSRPDVRASQIAMEAAAERSRLARYDYFNVAAALPDINSKGDKGFEAGPGMGMTVPVFHQNQGAIARVEAEVERLRRQSDRQRETVATEVRQAYTRLVRSQDDLAVWRDATVPQAEAAASAARGALREDAVSLLLVLETTRQLLVARQRELEAAAERRRALAELERSLGRRLVVEPPVGGRAEESSPAPLLHVEEVMP